MTNTVDIAIIGSGSAAFAAALEAVSRGARVTLIESAPRIGGTCVNVGCVPSKILIRGASIRHMQSHHPFEGIARQAAPVDRAAMHAQQEAAVATLRKARYESLLEQHPEIRLLRGTARFEGPRRLAIHHQGGDVTYLTPDRILVATGSRARIPDIPGLRATPFWTSTEALATDSLPEHLVVLGGSVVALELAQAFLRLGSRVTLLARSTLLSREDPLIGERLTEYLRAEGMSVHWHSLPDAISHHDGQFRIKLPDGTPLECDHLLVATGRDANTDGLNLESAGIETDAAGRIRVDNHLRTSQEHVFAAGDCTTLPQYVYVAAAAGTRAAINMTGGEATLDLSVLPTVVFTDPAVACVGLDERSARRQGVDPDTRVLALDQVPRAQANFDTRGFVKLVAERGSGRLLGCQLLAAEGGEVIQSAALALRAGMTVHELAEQLFPYLTMAEALKLCAQTFRKDVSQLSCCAG